MKGEEHRVEQQQQSPWRPTRGQLLWAGSIAAIAFLIIVTCGYLFGWKWTGFSEARLISEGYILRCSTA